MEEIQSEVKELIDGKLRKLYPNIYEDENMDKTKKLKTNIPNNPFDEVDDYDDFIYEDDLIDDEDVVIPPKVYLTSIIPNLDVKYVRKEWIKYMLNNMGEEEYKDSVDSFCRSMKSQIQKQLWKKEMDKLPPQTKNDEITTEFRKQNVERESEKLTNQIIDDMNGWYGDIKFMKKK